MIALLFRLVLAASLAVAAEAKSHSVLVVIAHPDDETAMGPLLAKLAHDGNAVHLFTITDGQRGATPNTDLPAGDKLGAVRDGELRCSLKALGIAGEPILMHLQDQGISVPPAMRKIAGELRAAINRLKPDIIVTWGPDGLTGHPDHRVASDIATQVFQQRGMLEHRPRKLYYLAFPESRFRNSKLPFGTVADEFITTEVDCRAFLPAQFAAQRCHKTQWSAEQIAGKEEMFAKTLDGRIFLRLALSDIPARGKETGLFAGLE